MEQWLMVTPWEYQHPDVPVSILHDCDGWALVKRGAGGLISADRWSSPEEAAKAVGVQHEATKPVDQKAGKP